MSGMRLMKRWNCGSRRCPNVGHLFWQPFSDDGRHYKLFNEDISRWNAAISTGEADVEFPPTSLKESLYLKDKLKGINGRKKENTGIPQSATTNQPSSSELPTTNSTNLAGVPSSSLPFAPPLSTPFHPHEFENQRTIHPFFHTQGQSLYNSQRQQFPYMSPAPALYPYMLHQSTTPYGYTFPTPHHPRAISPAAFPAYTYMSIPSMTQKITISGHPMVPIPTTMPSSTYTSFGSEQRDNSLEGVSQRQKPLSPSLSTQ